MVPGSVTCILQVPNKYLLNKRIKKDWLFLKVTQLIFREITQKNLGGTNHIVGQGKVPKTKNRRQYFIINNKKATRCLKMDTEFYIRKFSGVENVYLKDFFFTSPGLRGMLIDLGSSIYS